MLKNRIVVCAKCGALYDIHYIDKIKVRKNYIEKFECKNCGMVETTYKNLDSFCPKKTDTLGN